MKKTVVSIALLLALGWPGEAVSQSVSPSTTAGTRAEQFSVSGVVTDSQGEPVIGAYILIKGTSTGTISDVDGRFTLQSSERNPLLEVSYVGYKTQQVKVSGRQVDIVLEEDNGLLDELVVVGYGSMKRGDLTGAIDIVDSKRLTQQSNTMVSQQLQGVIPGLQVTRSSSMPGAGATIKVRGITSISDNTPLVIIDGVPATSVDAVNSVDVDQITVLKDAASASIYGARAAAGVILITTKKAQKGDVNISYNGELSIQNPTEYVETVGAIDYMNMFNEYKWNDAGNVEGGEYSQYEKEYIENYMENNRLDPIHYPNTNWKDLYLNDYALRHKHSVVLTYGNERVQTRASVGYENSDAIYDHYNFEQYRGRLKNHFDFGNNWEADVDFSFRRDMRNEPQTDLVIKHASKYPAVYLGVYPDGTIAPGKTGSNSLGELREGGYIENATNTFQAKMSLSYKPVKGLTLTATAAPLYVNSKSKDYNKIVPYYDPDDLSTIQGYISGHVSTSLTESRAERIEWLKQFIANYSKSFNESHNLDLMAGYEDFTYDHESLSASSDQFVLHNYPYLNLGNNNYLSNGGSATNYAYRSWFGRAAYNYQNRYYVQANLRADGSSRFHKDYRWGYFPSASLGWVISREKFMERTSDWLSNLKLRASLGSLGNERIGSYYPYQANISFNDALFVDAAGNTTSSMTGAQVDYAVTDISWETTQTWDVGVDASFFNNRLDLTADLYYKKTKDMLLEVKIPGSMGFGNPSQNAGEMSTKGWEVKVGWHDKIGDFGYGASFNISDYTSEMGDLSGTVFMGDKIIMEGSEYHEWYGYVSDGLFQTQEEVESSALLNENTKPGDVKYRDISGPDGVPDGKIDATYDKQLLGSSLPHFVYGGTLDFSYKGLAISLMFNGVGKRTCRMTEQMAAPFEGKWLSVPSFVKGHYWSVYNTPEQNLAARFPRFSETSLDDNYAMSDFWLFDGSYFRLQNVNISYTLPKKWLQKTFLDDARIYVSGQDLFTIDDFPEGWDPEVNVSTYIARTFTFGVDLKF